MASLVQHIDVVQAIVGALFMIVAFLMIRTLKQIDTNQKELFSRLTNIEKDFYTLQGEHKAMSVLHKGE